MQKRNLFIVVMIILFGTTFGQTTGKLAGTVTSKDGTPLSGANISISGTSFGAAADENGDYHILAIPVSSYSVRVDYIGYKRVTINNVRISGGLTTHLDVTMEVAAVEGESIVIVAKRPLVEISSTNAVRSVDGQQIGNFATRDIAAIIATQAGVVAQNNMLSIRGSRPDEVGYELEGATTRAVRVSGIIQTGQQAGTMSGGGGQNLVTVIPEAVEQLRIQSGGYSADLGGANAGIVQRTLKTGGGTLKGSLQYETDAISPESNSLNDLTLTLGGPLRKNIRLFTAVRKTATDNWNPQFWQGASIADGQKLPDLISGVTPSGDSVAVIIPDKIKGRTQTGLDLNSTLLFDFNPLVIRVGGTFSSISRRLNPLPVYALFNQDRLAKRDYTSDLLNVKASYFLSKDTYLTLNLNRLSSLVETYDPNFNHSSFGDLLAWGDSAVVAQKGLGTYKSRWTPPDDYNISAFRFQRPGDPTTGFTKNEQSYIGANGMFVTQMGNHEIKAGADWRRWTVRLYAIGADALKSINQQIDVTPGLQANFDSEDSTAATLIRRSRVNNIGYDEFGNLLDSGVDQAKHPSNFSYFANDKIETKDLIVNMGIRVDQYDLDDFEIDPTNPPYDKPAASVHADKLSKSKPRTIVEPRLGLGFPISDRGVFHLQYGKFAQMPDLAQPYKSRSSMALNLGGQNFIRDPVGFNLDPVITSQFEVGYAHQIGDNAALDITAFAKNTTGQLVVQKFTVPGDASYGAADFYAYVNGDFTTVNGVEFTLHTRRINHFLTALNYTYTDARGTNSFPNSNVGNTQFESARPTIITPLVYEQKHRGSFDLDFHTGSGEGGIFANSGINLLVTFNSGHPFTLSTGGMGQRAADEGALLTENDPRNRLPIEPIGASNTPWYFNTDLKADKSIKFGKVSLTAFLRVENLFNTKHVLNVYNRTGNAYDDGFLATPALSEKITAAQGASYVQMYQAINLANRQHFISDQGYDLFGVPRQVKLGITAAF